MSIKKLDLDFNETKSVYLIVGPEKKRKEIRESFNKEPLMCGDFAMKEREKIST